MIRPKRVKKETGDDEVISQHKRPRRSVVATVNSPIVDQVKVCQDLYEILRTHKTSEGRLLCQSFIRAPSKRNLPQYYEVVTTPLDLLKMHQKLKGEEYTTIDQLTSDVQLMVDNAKAYFARSCQEYKDANEIWDLYVTSLNQMLEGTSMADSQTDIGGTSSAARDTSSPAPSTRSLRSISPATRSTRSKDASPSRMSLAGSDPIDKCYLEDFLASIVTLTDDNKRVMSEAFKVLPSKQIYPEYYTVIKDPIDLRNMAIKMTQEKYKSVNEVEKDLLLMCKNAKQFNEPASVIYKDAAAISKFVKTRKTEILDAGLVPIPKERLKANSHVMRELSQLPAEPKVESFEEFGEDTDDKDEEIDLSNPLWKLYLSVRYFVDPLNQVYLAEPFRRLPSRKMYPDYFDEIKSPMSLYMIKYRLKRGIYKEAEDMLKDFNRMFENARVYNLEGSPVYVSANSLQNVAFQTAERLKRGMEVELNLPDQGDNEFSESEASEFEAEEEETSTSATPTSSSKSKKKKPVVLGPDGIPLKSRPGRKSMHELMQRYSASLNALFDTLFQFKDETGRFSAGLFLEKPSKKDYPDYYDVIKKPIDLKMIKANIDSGKYDSTQDLCADVTLMCANARQYNEESSQIYRDADNLEKAFRAAYAKTGDMFSPKVLKDKFGWRTIFSWSKAARSSALSPNGGKSSPLTPVRSSGNLATTKAHRRGSAANVHGISDELNNKLWSLFDAIQNYTDLKGRKLSSIFMRLPSKLDYPDYYEVIRKPIDLQKICAKLQVSNYESLEALAQDLNQMLDNACTYNDPESSIYKDSLTLQRVLLDKKAELKEGDDESGVNIDINGAVQELLKNLFITVYNHQDEEGRCYSDSLAELAELQAEQSSANHPVTLDNIKHNLDRGRYRRLDRFQEDIFQVFDAARKLNRTDSEMFEDSAELQAFFIRKRDEICGNGERFVSPALSYTVKDLAADLDEQRKAKIPAEKSEDSSRPEDPSCAPSKKKENDTELESVENDGITYSVGDFIYVKPNDEKLEPHIMHVVRIWKDNELDENFVSGNWFYRPHETFHLATRKFLEKEVFMSEFYDSVQVRRLVGRCYVLFVKDYFDIRPKGFDEKDIYVCESRYLGRVKHFKKLKTWPIDLNVDNDTFEARSVPVEPRRVPSVFISVTPESLQPSAAMEVDDDVNEEILEKHREEVVTEVSEPLPGYTYYEQMCSEGKWFKLGDSVYVDHPDKPEKARDIIRIDRMWRTERGEAFVCGFLFVRPFEMVHEPTRMFYKRELFVTNREETVPLAKISGRCAVLFVKEFCLYRPTEIPEADIYITENKLKISQPPQGQNCAESGESGGLVEPSTRRLGKGLKQYKLSADVLDDELYFFKKPIVPEKEPSPNLLKSSQSSSLKLNESSSMSSEDHKEIDIDDLLSGIDFTDYKAELDQSDSASTPGRVSVRNSSRVRSEKKSSKSGYILFSAEVRKRIMSENPTAPFGEISRIVGALWKNLTEDQKRKYDERATQQAQERVKEIEASGGNPHARPPTPHGQTRVWFCKWKECDYQFESSELLYEHITGPGGHTSQIVEGQNQQQHICWWASCLKYRKEKPFPSMPRMIRHIKEKHMPQSARCIAPHQRGKHYVGVLRPAAPSTPATPQPASSASATPGQSSTQSTAVAPSNAQHVVFYQQPGTTQDQAGVVVNQGQNLQQPVIVYQVPQAVTAGTVQQQGAVLVNPQQVMQMTNAAPSTSSAPQIVSALCGQDPGKTVVQAPMKPLEPVFVAPSNQRVQRALHSDIYLRYIESLNTDQVTVSKFDRYLGAKRENTAVMSSRYTKAAEWFKNPPDNKEEAAQMMWSLRDYMVHDVLNLDQWKNL